MESSVLSRLFAASIVLIATSFAQVSPAHGQLVLNLVPKKPTQMVAMGKPGANHLHKCGTYFMTSDELPGAVAFKIYPAQPGDREPGAFQSVMSIEVKTTDIAVPTVHANKGMIVLRISKQELKVSPCLKK